MFFLRSTRLTLARAQVVAGANVTGQYLSTRGEQGYVVTDTPDPLPSDALAKLAESEPAIWLRTWDA